MPQSLDSPLPANQNSNRSKPPNRRVLSHIMTVCMRNQPKAAAMVPASRKSSTRIAGTWSHLSRCTGTKPSSCLLCPEIVKTLAGRLMPARAKHGLSFRERSMSNDLSDRHALLARTEALAREIEGLSSSTQMTPEIRQRVAELKILHQELSARLQAVDRLQ
jgi:hypothetical protein